MLQDQNLENPKVQERRRLLFINVQNNDPFGQISPTTIILKLFIQNFWRTSVMNCFNGLLQVVRFIYLLKIVMNEKQFLICLKCIVFLETASKIT